MSSGLYFVGVDVGTGSARASLVHSSGKIVATVSEDTITYRDDHDHRIFEQSTTNIWEGIAKCIKSCLKEANVSPDAVKGIGFDATCSLAVSDQNCEPVVVTKGDKLGQIGDRNIILWADHRAEKEAELINSTGSVVLDYVGGVMSLEMEIPKTLWLKKHMDPKLFERCQFFDLPDFLTYKATGVNDRSACSVTCKCSFVPVKGGWQPEFFEKIGLKELSDRGFQQLGATDGLVHSGGTPIGKGLNKKSAEEFGLLEGTPVGSGLIDAYAGWVGTVAARYTENGELSPVVPSLDESRHRICAVAGTSTCHVVQSPEGVFVDGVWGPYINAVFDGWWMNEGGQSSTGHLIDFMITTHPAYNRLVEIGKKEDKNIHTVLSDILEKLQKEEGASSFTELTKDIHFYPDLHGNRSPIADPKMRGSIVGLQLDSGLKDLARKYNITLESIALQTRHIIDEMNIKGHKINSIYMSGSQAKNIRMMQTFADVCGMDVILPKDPSGAVVGGAAMLGRAAYEVGLKKGKITEEEKGKLLWDIMVEMTPVGTMVKPGADKKEAKLLEAKYKIFRESIEIQKRWRKEIEEASK
ncbi:Pentulose kinase [Flagelloscypha sp. PMI_526]|nr:Pentulose kinase [Flagelloscypha sp. PMI_526]